jgi:ubiquinone/menaquinone biosynthesis C-methylase UbiE
MARFLDRLRPGVRVLDVGCGPGRDVAWLAEQGFDIVGVDLSRKMLEEGLARDIAAPLVQADMGRLPFRKGSFRGIWSCASLLHVPKERAGDVLRELARVVRPGHIYLSVKCGEGEEWLEDGDGRRRFFAYYHPAELQLLMERSGFEVLSCWQNEDLAGRSHSWISALAWSKINTRSSP